MKMDFYTLITMSRVVMEVGLSLIDSIFRIVYIIIK